MAKVTVFNAARMLAIEARTVVSGFVHSGGRLKLQRHDGTIIDAGELPRGLPGVNAVENDEAVATYIDAEDSATRTALSATIAAALPPRLLSPLGLTGGETIATYADFGGAADLTVAIAGDSTANDTTDFVRLWYLDYITTLPTDVRCEYLHHFADGSGYQTVVDRNGVGTPASGGTIVSDTFTRTTANLVGSTSDNGKTWGGSGTGWSANGTHATAANAPGTLSYDVGSKAATVTAELTLTTTATGAAQRFDLAAGGTTSNLGSTRVYGFLTLSGTGGVATCGIYKNIGATATLIAASTGVTGVTAGSSTPQTVTMSLQLSGETVTLRFTPSGGPTQTVTASITAADADAMGTIAGMVSPSAAGAPGVAVNSITLATPPVSAVMNTFTLLNGAKAGTTLDWQQTRLADLYPTGTHIDALLVSGGHNYSNMVPTTFDAAVEDFLDDYFALHPETSLIVASQNPEYAPAPFLGPHRLRQAQVRLIAKRHGADYVPIYEVFRDRPDGGASLVDPDGIHPTTGVGGGQSEMARVLGDVVDARRVIAP